MMKFKRDQNLSKLDCLLKTPALNTCTSGITPKRNNLTFLKITFSIFLPFYQKKKNPQTEWPS